MKRLLSGLFLPLAFLSSLAFAFDFQLNGGARPIAPATTSSGSSCTTYATWNPSDKGAAVVLSNGNLTASLGTDMVRSTISKSSGKHYWEVTFDALTGLTIGIANSTASLTSYLGFDANGWSYYSSNGNKVNNVTQVAYGATYVAGDIVGVALDMDAGTITFYKNGASQGQAYSGLSGTMFAALGDDNSSGQGTANFGATAFTYTPPTGYTAGLCT